MYQLYVNPPCSSWSLRPWILLKTLHIPFEQKTVRYLDDLSEQRQQFLAFSPTSKIPVLHYQGQIIWDSLAIIEFIAEDYPQVWAEDRTARAWSRSACAEMHSGFEHLRSICHYDPINRTTLAEIPLALQTELKRINQLWEEGLDRFGGDYLAGKQFTAVDAFFVPVVGRIETYGLHHYFSESALNYQKRLLALPSLQQWLNS
ncbi:MAG: glutathione S-transferase [Pasteurella oralis]|uniref:glutathione S-transferase n=1 Tax=Pasteurella oralis TaxID=1071947 RepID=UPI0027066037|nr:glutathione S-transferase [Pasteurella oralis]